MSEFGRLGTRFGSWVYREPRLDVSSPALHSVGALV